MCSATGPVHIMVQEHACLTKVNPDVYQVVYSRMCLIICDLKKILFITKCIFQVARKRRCLLITGKGLFLAVEIEEGLVLYNHALIVDYIVDTLGDL